MKCTVGHETKVQPEDGHTALSIRTYLRPSISTPRAETSQIKADSHKPTPHALSEVQMLFFP